MKKEILNNWINYKASYLRKGAIYISEYRNFLAIFYNSWKWIAMK